MEPSTSQTSQLETTVDKPEETDEKLGGVFKCYICALEENYEYKGIDPPFCKHVKLLEECYMMEDPFSPPRNGEFLILGADCSICLKSVCKGSDCSFFYNQTYCASCVKTNIDQFPVQVKLKITKIFKH